MSDGLQEIRLKGLDLFGQSILREAYKSCRESEMIVPTMSSRRSFSLISGLEPLSILLDRRFFGIVGVGIDKVH